MAVTFLQTIAVAATTGDIEAPRLPQQLLARPQVHDVWVALVNQAQDLKTTEQTVLQNTRETAISKARPVRPIGAIQD